MNKFASRKLIVSLVALISAVATAYTAIDPEVQQSLMDFLGTLITFYLLGQGAVDTAGALNKPAANV